MHVTRAFVEVGAFDRRTIDAVDKKQEIPPSCKLGGISLRKQDVFFICCADYSAFLHMIFLINFLIAPE